MTRRPSSAEESALAATFTAAMNVSEKMRADGASREDREAYIANVLRASWPKGRTEPWHYLCDACDDSGWRFRTCYQRSCGRPFRLPGQAGDDATGRGHCAAGHTYVEPCRCPKGQERRRQLLKERRPDDAVEVAIRSKPTRVGR